MESLGARQADLGAVALFLHRGVSASARSSVAVEIDLKSRRRGNLQRYAVPEMAVSWPHSTVPWLQRQLLPTAVMEPSEDESAVRDRVIDGVLVLVAAVLGGPFACVQLGRDGTRGASGLKWARLGCVCGARASPSAPNCRRRPRARWRRPCRRWRGWPRWSRCSTPQLDRRLARWLGSSRCPSSRTRSIRSSTPMRTRRLLGHDGTLRARDVGRDRLGTVRANATGAGCVAAGTRSAARVRAAAAGRAGA